MYIEYTIHYNFPGNSGKFMSSKDIKEGDDNLGSAQIVYMAVKSWTEICRLLVKTAWTVFMFTFWSCEQSGY